MYWKQLSGIHNLFGQFPRHLANSVLMLSLCFYESYSTSKVLYKHSERLDRDIGFVRPWFGCATKATPTYSISLLSYMCSIILPLLTCPYITKGHIQVANVCFYVQIFLVCMPIYPSDQYTAIISESVAASDTTDEAKIGKNNC